MLVQIDENSVTLTPFGSLIRIWSRRAVAGFGQQSSALCLLWCSARSVQRHCFPNGGRYKDRHWTGYGPARISMPVVAKYRKRAKDCRALAARLSNPADKNRLEYRAEAWAKMADLRERNLIGKDVPSPASARE